MHHASGGMQFFAKDAREVHFDARVDLVDLAARIVTVVVGERVKVVALLTEMACRLCRIVVSVRAIGV